MKIKIIIILAVLVLSSMLAACTPDVEDDIQEATMDAVTSVTIPEVSKEPDTTVLKDTLETEELIDHKTEEPAEPEKEESIVQEEKDYIEPSVEKTNESGVNENTEDNGVAEEVAKEDNSTADVSNMTGEF